MQTQTYETKVDRLKEIIQELESVLVAYSGGVDSTLLLKLCGDLLGPRTLAVIATSETYPSREIDEAKVTAQALGARYEVIATEELANEDFASNPSNRCYYCKTELFSKLRGIADERGLKWVLDGSNYDDLDDHRPGRQAAKEIGVRSPLMEAGLTKMDIRMLSRELGLPTWNKPSFACLSSRFPYGDRITLDKLGQIDQAEQFIRDLGFVQVRVRHHDAIARIELPKEDLPRLLANGKGELISQMLKGLGFTYVTVDLQGYRSGSMNETLS